MAPLQRQIIVGIDYGTTKTCVTYAVQDVSQPHEPIVQTLYIEAGPSLPSTVSYSENGVQWGTAAKSAPHSCSWTKLLLDGSHPSALNNVPEQFLHGQFNSYNLSVIPVHFWFAIPATWSPATTAKMETAITAAGFRDRKHDQVSFVTEPEAAGLYIARHQHREFKAYASDALAPQLCKASKLTDRLVDVAAFAIEKKSGQHPFYRRLAETSGVNCGGALVDIRLLSSIARHLEHDLSDLPTRTASFDLAERVEAIKHVFLGSRWPQILRPTAEFLDLVHTKHPTLKVTSAEIKNAIEDVVSQVIELVHGNLHPETPFYPTSAIQTVVLVGGMSQNPYFVERVRRDLLRSVTLVTPRQYETALVAHGATLRGLEGAVVSSLSSTKNYGLVPDFPAAVDNHSLEQGPQTLPLWWRHQQGKQLDVPHEGSLEFSLYHEESNPLVKSILIVESDHVERENPVLGDEDVRSIGILTCNLQASPLQRFVHGRAQGQGGKRYLLRVRVDWSVPVNTDVVQLAAYLVQDEYVELVGSSKARISCVA
ncbi:hypothetical protein BO71DRAFT_433577 [Aspergillus ellipticus CBS 707.79]|uniref:Actin-like ATPase domain-containing protein n=1 Tax=Aspergillus ellipticus CBS 707.79 TaxID=1448320 RepID=A0A319D167_9EURO|nr:hypothetical protein BO71DRAFT_433577 [Aspergillus ellipticus CBS 707.79]